MSFTDDELKRLKEDLVPYFPHKLEALIARLEAAEKAMNHFCSETVLNECCHPYLTAWRKEAGK